MSKENYLHKIKELPEAVKQFGGLVTRNDYCNFIFCYLE